MLLEVGARAYRTNIMDGDGLERRLLHPVIDLLQGETQPHIVERIHHPGLLVLHEVCHDDLATGTKHPGALREDPCRVRGMVYEEAQEHGIEGTIVEGKCPALKLDESDLVPSAQHLLASADVALVEIEGGHIVSGQCQGTECIAVLTAHKEDIHALDQVHEVVRDLLVVIDAHQTVKVTDEPRVFRGGSLLLLLNLRILGPLGFPLGPFGALGSSRSLPGPLDLLRLPLDFGVDRFLFLVLRVSALLIVYQNTSETLPVSIARLTSMVIRRPVLIGFLQSAFP